MENLHKNTNEQVSNSLSKEVDRKMETFEKKLQILVKVSEEKDAIINDLKKHVKELETKFTKETKVNEDKFASLENKIFGLQQNNEIVNDKLTNLEKNREAKFKCKECKYTTASGHGLKTHVAKKHNTAQKKEEMLTFPITCELCDKELKNLETHLSTF